MTERKRCAGCSKEIVGRGLCVEGSYYHPDCFCCDKCKSPLSGKFHKQDGQRICEGCKAYSYCEGCRRKIEGKETHSEGRAWHPECFKCSQCDLPIMGSFCRIAGELTCAKCRDKATLKKNAKEPAELATCRGCKKPVKEDESSILADKRDMFHEACFKCTKCAKPLNSYVILDERKFSYQDCPYFCDPCASFVRAAFAAEAKAAEEAAAEAVACVACGGACGAKCEDSLQLVDGRVLHLSCFKCCNCNLSPFAPGEKVLQLPLLRSKVDALLRGEYHCTTCAPKPPMSQGYIKAQADNDEESQTAQPVAPAAPQAQDPPAPAPAAPAVVPLAEPMTLEELQNPDIWKARGIDAASREQMLSDVDFQSAFGVSKEDFGKLPAWKRAQKKRELKLF